MQRTRQSGSGERARYFDVDLNFRE
ncbi:hypothetical protein PybrP1_010109 [[Pythium] brassicae (nom. inval.)]|nr:hypothetical protein PybrP1_010109 [[Pythium] brassicae (nom. inval.)]